MSHIQLSVLIDCVMKAKALDAEAAQHVESCPHCRSDLRWLQQLEGSRKLEPPKWAVDAVIKEFKQRHRKVA
jgi:hypothetical protein